MTRLIDADRLRDHLEEIKDDYFGTFTAGVEEAIEEIDNASTIYPEEISKLIETCIRELPPLIEAMMKNLPQIIEATTKEQWLREEAPTEDSEITNDDLQAAMTESYHLGYELAETKFKRPHGKWSNVSPYTVHCSVCNKNSPDMSTYIKMKFCPNCGAKMDKKEADNEADNM